MSRCLRHVHISGMLCLAGGAAPLSCMPGVETFWHTFCASGVYQACRCTDGAVGVPCLQRHSVKPEGDH